MTERLTVLLLHFSYVTDTVAGALQRELNLVLCNNLEGWEWAEGGRETPEGGDTCTPMVDSC